MSGPACRWMTIPICVRWMTENVEQLACWKATHVGEGFVAVAAA